MLSQLRPNSDFTSYLIHQLRPSTFGQKMSLIVESAKAVPRMASHRGFMLAPLSPHRWLMLAPKISWFLRETGPYHGLKSLRNLRYVNFSWPLYSTQTCHGEISAREVPSRKKSRWKKQNVLNEESIDGMATCPWQCWSRDPKSFSLETQAKSNSLWWISEESKRVTPQESQTEFPSSKSSKAAKMDEKKKNGTAEQHRTVARWRNQLPFAND